MRGYITEIDFEQVDEAFPGIIIYYKQLRTKPTTFLELLWGFTHREQLCAETVQIVAGQRPRASAR